MSKGKHRRKLISAKKVMRRMETLCNAKCAMIAAVSSATVAAVSAARMVRTDPSEAITLLGNAIENGIKVNRETAFDIHTSMKWLRERGLK
jgi:hypothetical protein